MERIEQVKIKSSSDKKEYSIVLFGFGPKKYQIEIAVKLEKKSVLIDWPVLARFDFDKVLYSSKFLSFLEINFDCFWQELSHKEIKRKLEILSLKREKKDYKKS